MWLNVTAVTGTLTFVDRKNGAAGGQSLSITTTGTKEDTSGTTSLSAATPDLYNLQGTMSGTHGDTATVIMFAVLLDDGAVGSALWMTGRPAGTTTNTGLATADFVPLSGYTGITWTTTEAKAQLVVRQAVIVSNIAFNLTANTYADTTTWRFRNNGANGNQAISVAAASTGWKEDTVATDSVVAGDLICGGRDAGGVSGSARIPTVEITTSGTTRVMSSSATLGVAITATAYSTLTENLSTNATESNLQVKVRVADTFSNLQSYVSANTRSDDSTVDFRAGAASPGGGPSISIASSSTGLKEDNTGSYVTAATDLINFRTLIGGGSGTLTLTTIGVQQGVGVGFFPPWPPRSPFPHVAM